MRLLLLALYLASLATATAQTVSSQQLARSLKTDGIKEGPDGKLYIAGGWDATTLHRADADGALEEFASGLQGPIDMVFVSPDTVVVSNWAGRNLVKITMDGTLHDFVSFTSQPSGMAADNAGNLYVSLNQADAPGPEKAGFIGRVTPNGEWTVFAQGGTVNRPVGLTFDTAGNLYAGNLNDGRITRIAPDGSQSLVATVPGTGQFRIGHLKFAHNTLYATALSAHRIYLVSLDGTVTPFAGTGAAGRQDGPVAQSQFRNPNGLALTGDGNALWIIGTLQPTAWLRRIDLPRPTQIEQGQHTTPADFKLGANFPNPFNPRTAIAYALPQTQHIALRVYDALGSEVAVLVDQLMPQGRHQATWDATDRAGRAVASGVYFYQLSAGNKVLTDRMVLLR
ncbi:MAG: T9SS type A sorting domain-containing protein [Candidatus Latescibacteria bacterium]|nr:T9SS type A sorting domain-containing protein [Candidatus Latescibacterota bacterium]